MLKFVYVVPLDKIPINRSKEYGMRLVNLDILSKIIIQKKENLWETGFGIKSKSVGNKYRENKKQNSL